jgi:hypothetical protein
MATSLCASVSQRDRNVTVRLTTVKNIMQLVTAYNGGVSVRTCDDHELTALQVNNCNIQEHYILGYDAISSVGVHL